MIAFGLVGAGLLSTRQSRLQAGHEVTAARLRIREHDERLLRFRAEIAGHVAPAAVRDMIAKHQELGGLEPIAERVHSLPGRAFFEPVEPDPDSALLGTEAPPVDFGTTHAP